MHHLFFKKHSSRLSSVPVSLGTVLLLVAIGFSAFSQPGLAASTNSSQSFAPVSDAYVDQSQPATNYGTGTTLRMDGSPVVRSYLRFDVSGVTSGSVTKATLRIYVKSKPDAAFTVRRVADNSWQETQIKFNNAPALGAVIKTSPACAPNTWVNIDVTAVVQANGSYSVAVVEDSQTAVSIASRESGSHSPALVVETAAAVTPTSTRIPPTATPVSTKTPAPTATTPPSGDFQPAFPIRAAFYYPWFPEAWNQQGFNPFTIYTPSLGYYNSSTVSTIQNHINAMTYGNINAGIMSWWGQGSPTDNRVATILGATPGSSNPNFRWSLYYENESMGDPSVSQIQSDLSYISAHYGSSPSFLRVNGHFVVFVYSDANDNCGMADRWVQANQALGNPAYVVLKVFSGYRSCASQPSSWHQYCPAVATDLQSGYSYSVSPGFWKKGDAVRLGRDLARWTTNVQTMAASGQPWQLVTTFNEWGEGTIVESAAEWASPSGYGQYMDALHNNGSGTPPQPTATRQATNPPPATATATLLPTRSVVPTQTRTATQPPAPTATPPANGSDPIIFFTGDLVSSSSVSRAQKVVNLINSLMAQHPGTQMLVASTGDNEQENNPTVANYQSYFGTTYGPFVTRGIFMQVRGNHDIQSAGSYTDYNGTVHSSGAAYWDYFGANAHAFNISGQKLTDYSYDLGAWHFVALDQLNGSVNSASLNFMTSDLAAHASSTCQLVYWHVPTYSSGAAHGDSTGLKPYNQAEYNAGVDIQINGHDHDYQRFNPIDPNGVRDDARGITTFIDGLGGQDGRSGSKVSVAQSASAVYMDAFPGGEAIGVIQFVLHANSADYTLYDGNTGAILDHGTVTCH